MTDVVPTPTAAELIAEYNQIERDLARAAEKIKEALQPKLDRQAAIKSELHRSLLALNGGNIGKASFATDYGTAYLSTTETPSLPAEHQVAFLDWVEEDFNARGALLKIATPSIVEIRSYRSDNNGALPPFVKVTPFTNVNINKTGAKK